MLKVNELECVRGDRLLFSQLSFTVTPGNLLHVQGANGSGKTTLLRAICGLLQPQVGTIYWHGKNIHSIRDEFYNDILYLGHLNGIKPDLTGIENLRISATLSGLAIKTSLLWEALQRMGLNGFEDLQTKVLSQGQKRRVALAKLLLSRAPLWILDEPFVGLDNTAVDLILKILANHLAHSGMIIITTHQDLFIQSGSVHCLKLT
jgi:heme exporter protein A